MTFSGTTIQTHVLISFKLLLKFPKPRRDDTEIFFFLVDFQEHRFPSVSRGSLRAAHMPSPLFKTGGALVVGLSRKA